MQRLEVSDAVRLIYKSLGVKGLITFQNLLYIVPLMRHTTVLRVSSINFMDIGCFSCVNINLFIVLIDISDFVTSRGILFKILILGIIEMMFAFPLKF